MKRLIALLICFSIVFAPAVYAADIVDVVIDGEVMEFDVPAQIYDDRTMVPMRAIFERLGAEVEWIEEGQLIFAIKDDVAITMKIDQNFFTIKSFLTDETRQVELDVAPMIVNDRTLVPVRAVAESLECIVDWDEETETVIITSQTEE